MTQFTIDLPDRLLRGIDGVIGLADRTVAPTTNPAGGGVLYAERGR